MKRSLYALGRAFQVLALWTWQSMVLFFTTTFGFTRTYINGVMRFTVEPDIAAPATLMRFGVVRFLFRVFLLAFVPIILLIVPVGYVTMVVALAVLLDQTVYPKFPVDRRFITIAEEVNGKKPRLEDIGATLMTASYLQLERELDSWTGWLPNDIGPLRLFDNTVNRQLGVKHASYELLQALSIAISKLGSTDEENPLLVKARQEGFSYQPGSWMFPESEDQYRMGIELIKKYQRNLQDLKNATINITNQDIETILVTIDTKVLEVPHGRLNSRNFTISWSELDDRVYFAQGAAIVARDALVAIQYAFGQKVEDAGATENLKQAITSLEGATNFNPWWVTRGDGDSMFADHRSKLSRYYTDARTRIRDVAEAIKR